MQLAIIQAQRAGDAGEVPVGAIIIGAGGELIASAANRPITDHDPSAHAEIVALRQAGQKIGNYRLTGCTLYVTLEPCTMCAGAISHARIGRLVYGAPDVKGGAVQNGARFFDSPSCHHSPEIIGGVLQQDCAALLKDFFKARRAQKARRSQMDSSQMDNSKRDEA